MVQIDFIKKHVSAPESGIANTIKLLSEDCTIPFISRYRKDQTGNLDEVIIEQIAKFQKEFLNLSNRRESILRSIEEQGAMTAELRTRIESSFDLQELEDIYLPYKKRKKTRADVAREKGLEPLAKIIMSQNSVDIDFIAGKYINNNVANEDEALQGARDIIAEWISENVYVRRQLRRIFERRSAISSKQVKLKSDATEDQKALSEKFRQYADWSEPLHKTPPHRLLALLRGENEGVLKIKLEIDGDDATSLIENSIIKNKSSEAAGQISLAIADSYKRLLYPAISNDVLQEFKSKADDASIKVFASNLSQLLMASPLGQKRIMGIDPGFRSGCKIVCLDEKGDLLYNETIFPNPPQSDVHSAIKKIRSLANAYKVQAIAIGNGTASRETEAFIKKVPFDHPVEVYIVSEAGASVYSASKIAREEFPNYDVTVRGAVSIGRRLSDPLAELVKIDPKAIGVGQYQHDVDQNKLREELDIVVMRCVNAVGVNLNTAGKHLLSYVSGIGEKLAENIVDFRTKNGLFSSRSQLRKVPRLGEKAFQQAAAFIRISNSDNPLDNSAVHPEAYEIVEKMAKDLKVSVAELIGNKVLAQKIDPEIYISGPIGKLAIQDIIKELQKPGLDPRKSAKVLEFDSTIRSISDLREGMMLPGIINNITNFGCFVDIGIKESGLVHISQIKAEFVKDVNDAVKLHQHVMVKVVEIDVQRKRIQLTMIL